MNFILSRVNKIIIIPFVILLDHICSQLYLYYRYSDFRFTKVERRSWSKPLLPICARCKQKMSLEFDSYALCVSYVIHIHTRLAKSSEKKEVEKSSIIIAGEIKKTNIFRIEFIRKHLRHSYKVIRSRIPTSEHDRLASTCSTLKIRVT